MKNREEVWKDIEGHEGLYQISNKGNVKSFNVDSKGVLLKIHLDRYGYEYVALSTKKHKVHRLVAKAFIDNPKNKKTVNHKNEVKTDNRVENLEWMTVREQNQYSRSTPVFVFMEEEIKRYPSVRDAASKLGCTEDKIVGLSKEFDKVLKLSQSVLNNDSSFNKNYEYVQSYEECQGIIKKNNKYRVRLTINGKREHIGDYEFFEEAIDARNKNVIKHGLRHKICVVKEKDEKIKDSLYTSLRFLKEHVDSEYKEDSLINTLVSNINISIEKLNI